MKEAAKRLEELIRLENGWDGYDAKSVKPENAKFALEILKQVCEPSFPTPQIVPGCNGDLQIEWYTKAISIELHIIAPCKVHFWASNTGPDGGIYLTSDFTKVKQTIKKL